MFHVELAPLGVIFGPLKSDLGAFWRDFGSFFAWFYNVKTQKSVFSKRARQKILFLAWVVYLYCVLRVPEEKLAVHNFLGWVLSEGIVPGHWASSICGLGLTDHVTMWLCLLSLQNWLWLLLRGFTVGLGEIGHEDRNFKIKTCTLGFWWEIEF